jgi:hypothetical protein
MCTSCLYNEKEKVVDEEFCNSQTEIEQPFHLFANSRQIIPVQPENYWQERIWWLDPNLLFVIIQAFVIVQFRNLSTRVKPEVISH